MHYTLHDIHAARQDRASWLNWKPYMGRQMAIALVDALIKSKNNGPVEKRIAQIVKTMH